MDVTDRVLDKLDKIDDRLNKIDVTQAEIRADLNLHMSRTEAVEQTNELLKDHIDKQAEKLDARLGKLEKWYDKFHYLGWLLVASFGVVEKFEKVKSLLHSLF